MSSAYRLEPRGMFGRECERLPEVAGTPAQRMAARSARGLYGEPSPTEGQQRRPWRDRWHALARMAVAAHNRGDAFRLAATEADLTGVERRLGPYWTERAHGERQEIFDDEARAWEIVCGSRRGSRS